MLDLPAFPRATSHENASLPGFNETMVTFNRIFMGGNRDEARMSRAAALFAAGDLDAASAALMAILDTQGNGNAHVHQLLGEIFVRKGQYDKASVHFGLGAEALNGKRAFSPMDGVAPRDKEPIWRRLRSADFLSSAAAYAAYSGDTSRALVLRKKVIAQANAILAEPGLALNDVHWAKTLIGEAQGSDTTLSSSRP